MPIEAAQYWFAIESVQIEQMAEIDRLLREKAALPKTFSRFAKEWDVAFPNFPCLGDRWVIVLPEFSVKPLPSGVGI